ncbi:DUF808 domain-containing protein [Sulfurimonas sp. HSL1-6]|uniref:DUF808 domain-containing protein n=1 Tax=Thiomicrolovo immobilis TaxID=3131935 RepID=UPI0031F8BB94
MTGGFFAILDDIAALLDDTAVMSKVAAKKVGGVLGDDLAVNAEQASGHASSRELPVLWAITKGSFRNKAIILPVAFLLSAFAPWAIVPILMLGAAYLSYEGAEKVLEYLRPGHHGEEQKGAVDEAAKITSAVRTDFILSIEIIVIALGVVAGEALTTQVLVVTLIALLATVGVYGIVALMVRMDDMGFALVGFSQTSTGTKAVVLKRSGLLLVQAMPKLIKALGYIGTVAMLLVGGGIFVHHVEWLHHALAFMPFVLPELVSGLAAGMLLVALVLLWERLTQRE